MAAGAMTEGAETTIGAATTPLAAASHTVVAAAAASATASATAAVTARGPPMHTLTVMAIGPSWDGTAAVSTTRPRYHSSFTSWCSSKLIELLCGVIFFSTLFASRDEML